MLSSRPIGVGVSETLLKDDRKLICQIPRVCCFGGVQWVARSMKHPKRDQPSKGVSIAATLADIDLLTMLLSCVFQFEP